jgi:hypothetical protein
MLLLLRLYMPETASSSQAALLFRVMLLTAQCLPWMLNCMEHFAVLPKPCGAQSITRGAFFVADGFCGFNSLHWQSVSTGAFHLVLISAPTLASSGS